MATPDDAAPSRVGRRIASPLQFAQPTCYATAVEVISILAGHLDFEVVAKGIESKTQGELITSLACSARRGYAFARPLSATEAETSSRFPPPDTASHTPSSLTN